MEEREREERENKKGDGRKLRSSLNHEAGFGREILETTREEEHISFLNEMVDVRTSNDETKQHFEYYFPYTSI